MPNLNMKGAFALSCAARGLPYLLKFLFQKDARYSLSICFIVFCVIDLAQNSKLQSVCATFLNFVPAMIIISFNSCHDLRYQSGIENLTKQKLANNKYVLSYGELHFLMLFKTKVTEVLAGLVRLTSPVEWLPAQLTSLVEWPPAQLTSQAAASRHQSRYQ